MRLPYSYVKTCRQGHRYPPKVLLKVFDPFFTTKDPDKGTGLGMSICKSIVEQFSGTIEIKPTSDKGTTVTVSLPVVELRN